MIRFCYSVTGILLTPLIRIWIARRTRRGKEDAARINERFGRASTPRPSGKLIWLHAASVGETQSVLTLVRALLAADATLNILITTGTVTSAALVAQQKLARVTHQFIPIDTHPVVHRFLTHWHPDLALWVESEFWPQLLWQTHARRTPMLLINARMSERSYEGWRKWPHTIRSLLSCFAAIYVGSAEDAQRFAALGAKNLHDVGNLKYDASPLAADAVLLSELTAATQGRRVWVAASTHANEEHMIADVHAQLLQQFPDLLCIIIPRHATRGDAIAADLRAKHAALAQRSKREPIGKKTQLYLADTMGELGSFYRLADLVFLGGSLVATGGHNPLEPARLSAALVTGPHVHNFAAIMQHLNHAGALRIVQDKTELAQTLDHLLRNDSARLLMAERAMDIVQHAHGASEHIVQHALTLLAETHP